MIQHLFDGVLVGAILSLGAIGLTLTMHILRFANFSHAELLSLGAYAALVFDGVFAAALPVLSNSLGRLSVSVALFGAIVIAMTVTGLSAVAIDRLVFRRLRARAGPLSMVFASFGVALIVRNLIGLVFGLGPKLYSDDIAFAFVLSADPMVLVKPDQLFVLAVTLVLMIGVHLVLTLTPFGLALQAVSENPVLAQ
ncbi:MAG: branched-chain amino acid ABC transporter permease, partial [Gammaproteobacteria bacterium]